MNLILILLAILCLSLAARLCYLRFYASKRDAAVPAVPAAPQNVGETTQTTEKTHDEAVTTLAETTYSEEAIPEPLSPDTEEGQAEEHEERRVTQNQELISNLHKVFEEDKVFLRSDIHIEDVAKMLCTNRTYVTQLMRQEYGLSFIEYVNVARIQHSQSLLYSTSMTLDEIAEQSGFQSTTNYCRAFKRYIGKSPMNWLQEVKQDK